MTRDLWIVGASGFGREVEHLVRAINERQETRRIVGFVDDAPSDENRQLVEALGHRVVGGVDALLEREPAHYVIGIGSG